MTIELIKRLLDACYEAKRIRDMLPPLPDGVTSSYIHFLDVIEQMEKNGTSVKVSDISDALNLPRPGVTRTVKEMEKKGYLTKKPSEEDARIMYLFITDEAKSSLPSTMNRFLTPCCPIWRPSPVKMRNVPFVPLKDFIR